MSKILTETDFIFAARQLDIDVPSIKAVAEVEAPRGGFLPDGRPVILFEAHIFARETGGKYNNSHPDISSQKWNRTLYKGGAGEYQRLEKAKQLNEIAALKSASWGKFQIMGFNFVAAGYSDVKTFVQKMYESEKEHLNAFVNFLKYHKMDVPLRTKNWTEFARRYNGPAFAQNQYDSKIAKAFAKYSIGYIK